PRRSENAPATHRILGRLAFRPGRPRDAFLRAGPLGHHSQTGFRLWTEIRTPGDHRNLPPRAASRPGVDSFRKPEDGLSLGLRNLLRPRAAERLCVRQVSRTGDDDLLA